MIDLTKIATLRDFIEAVAHTYNQHLAFKYRPRFRSVSFTYQDIFDLARATVFLLKQAQVAKGDRVLLWGYNSPYWVAGFFGTQLLGAVAVPLSFQSQSDFIKKIADQTRPKFLLKSQVLAPQKALKLKSQDLESLKSIPNVTLPKVKIAAGDLAEIIYTSGTTGFPKGVMLTHKNILSNLQSVLSIIKISPSDRGLSILPLSHMFEQVAGMLAPLSCGITVTHPGPINPINIRKALQEDRITLMAAVPEFLKLTIKRIEEKIPNLLFKIGRHIPAMSIRRLLFYPVLQKLGGHLATIFSGGAALDPVVGQKWESLGIYVLQGYGTTEASPVISANTYDDRKIASVGKPVPGVTVKIAQDGEILARGDNIFVGYWQNPQKTKEAFQNGWLKTGDLGQFDSTGHLYIRGRKKYLIVTEAGENVYPEDIEFELSKFKEITDSCVIGLPRNGKLVIHAVLLGPKIEKPEQIITLVNQRLAPYQQIQDWSIWPFSDFPRTVTRKVKRDEVLQYLTTRKVEKEALQPVPAGQVEKIFAKITGLPMEKIQPEKKLVGDLKMDSLERVELVATIEEETGVILDEAAIGSATTVADIKKMAETKIQKIEKHPFRQWPLTQPVTTLRAFAQKLLLFPVTNYFVKIEVQGEKNLANLNLPVLFYANHLSAIDPAIIVKILPGQIRKRLAIAAAADLLFDHGKYATWGGLLTFLFNIYPFARFGQIKSSLEYTGRLLDRGFSILVFPEGRVSTSGRLQPFKDGVGFLAVEMQVPTVPIKIAGTPKIIAPGVELPCWPKRGEVSIRIGRPLIFEPNDSYIEATKIIENTLKKL